MGDFKKLRVWTDACRFADRVEQMARGLPQPDRRWAFDQLVPAAHAIHEIIAEGWGFDSDAQRAEYCRRALSSGNETEDELLALTRKALLADNYRTLPAEARSVCAQLASLKMRIDESIAKARAARRKPKPAARRRPEPGPDRPKPSG